ncbi:MAG: hypothetical protein NWQ54_24680 [Paraglaciecola sp.]|uniref:hypothetical protein n=1 Tax=Paraglaciecola sp. TaxID=1920173 RepID=UPI00273DE2DA|nr:hypothetical protein [Paraglaciecola sp.]MDP5031657.1 hypothetical protein [Paraglaciecola sp.]MDP5134093.1 hypothetical protein [Paraglaciecola sp.]
MIKITEKKLLAFEAFLNQQSNKEKSAFEAFTLPKSETSGKSVIELLEEEDKPTNLSSHSSS